MPLQKGSSREVISANIAELIKAGHTPEQAEAIAYREAGLARDALVMDRSERWKDQDGNLHVAISNISKATVNPYRGREIPNYQALGLEPDRLYNMLRDPEELAKGAKTFDNLRLLSKHVAVSANDPKEELVAGSTGTDAEFKYPYLVNSLVIWRAEDIRAVESGNKCELSCAYYYDPDMKSGVYKGLPYDGIMRNIRGNHVALVEAGRAGPDVMVHDAKEIEMPAKPKNLKAIIAEAKAALAADSLENIRKSVSLAFDAMEEFAKAEDDEVDGMDEDEEETEEEKAKRLKAEAKDKAKDKAAKDKAAKDKDPEEKIEEKEKDDKAMDAAIDAASARIRAEMNAAVEAREIVRPLVGRVSLALDSADAIYKHALEAHKINITGVPASAYKAMVSMIKAPSATPAVAMDSAPSLLEKFPALSRINQA